MALRSDMLARAWDVPGVGEVRLVNPSREMLCALDETWPAMRFADDWHHVWRWATICHRKEERFVLLRGAEPVAIWCCDRDVPLKLPEGDLYEVKYAEVRSDLRGGILGHFLFGVIAARAIEHDAAGLLLQALPIDGLVATYEKFGAKRRVPKGWTPTRKLVPLVIERARLTELKDLVDGLLQESPSGG